MSDEIRSLLDMNKNPNKIDVAQNTILKHHFCAGKSDIHALTNGWGETSLATWQCLNLFRAFQPCSTFLMNRLHGGKEETLSKGTFAKVGGESLLVI